MRPAKGKNNSKRSLTHPSLSASSLAVPRGPIHSGQGILTGPRHSRVRLCTCTKAPLSTVIRSSISQTPIRSQMPSGSNCCTVTNLSSPKFRSHFSPSPIAVLTNRTSQSLRAFGSPIILTNIRPSQPPPCSIVNFTVIVLDLLFRCNDRTAGSTRDHASPKTR